MATEFTLSKIGVIMLGVADLDRAIHFYRDQLRLQLSASTGEFAFLQAGGVTLALRTEASKTLNRQSESVEVVFSVDHVHLAYQELGRRGVHFTHSPHLVAGAHWAANFNDPDGHSLSVFGPE